MTRKDDMISQVASWLSTARRAVVFTGAGMSTESGIPDFRSPNGVWSKNEPVYYGEFLASAEARFENAVPNAGHRIIARWEQAGRVAGVITQNIDGLHQVAGSRRVLELHGTARWIVCVDCQERFEPRPLIAEFRERKAVPDCQACGGRLKSATVSFGQSLPPDVLEESLEMTSQSDVFLAIGSSLVVYPAAGLPEVARRAGAKLVIINRDPTDQDALADAVLHEPIGQTLTRLDEAMRQANVA
jgi:NAD-dependent deacetylase